MNSSSALVSKATSTHESRRLERRAGSGEAAHPSIKPEPFIKPEPSVKIEDIMKVEENEEPPVESDAQLATQYRGDLISMRISLTCSICDQLLYEPWTLQCGHTYCYSCLCQWFITNRRRKTCPECRNPVKQMPAPAFLVRDMVQVFINRGQLMPHDETVEQHKTKKAEESQIVEDDRNSAEGLFKGTFPPRHGELWHDEADGVMRCPACGHEHEGGPTCESCGAEFEDMFGFSDGSIDADLSDIEVDSEDEAMPMHPPPHYYQPGLIQGAGVEMLAHYHAHHNNDFMSDDTTDNSEFYGNHNSEDEGEGDDEDAGSLEDFIAPDDEDPELVAPSRRANQRAVTIISDDEDDESEDEGGAVTSRRRPTWTRTPQNPSISAMISEDENDSSANGSELDEDEIIDARRRLRESGGWSPLDEGEDDDTEGFAHHGGYTTTEDERAIDESDSESNSETIGHPDSDVEDDDGRPYSQVRHYQTPDYRQNPDDYPSSMDGDDTPIEYTRAYATNNYDGEDENPYEYDNDGDSTPVDYARDRDNVSTNYDSEHENPYEYDTDGGRSNSMDRDGDTEMSVSPGLSRAPRSGSVDSYYADLGVANEMAEDDDDDDSDTSIRPPPRRQPRHMPIGDVQQQYELYNPRVGMMFAQHQDFVRNSQYAPRLNGWGVGNHNAVQMEPTSRNHRRVQYCPRLSPLANNTRHTFQRVTPSIHPPQYQYNDRAITPRVSPPLRIVSPRIMTAFNRNGRPRQYAR